MSYFLWNAAPDEQLRELAASGKLHDSIDSEVDRMIDDAQFEQFTSEFVSQWLQLDKFEVVEIDRGQFPKLTRDTKRQLRREPVELVQFLIRNNLPLRNLIQLEFQRLSKRLRDSSVDEEPPQNRTHLRSGLRGRSNSQRPRSRR